MKKTVLLSLMVAATLILYSCWQWQTPPNGEIDTITGEIDTITGTETDEGSVNTGQIDTTTWSLNDTWSIIDTGSEADEKSESKTYMISITSTWFSPSTLTIKSWDRVDFVNKDSATHWPASGPHPVHTNYPGSWIEKCWTREASNIFDACKALAQNETFSFIFKEKWTWWYHDHRNPDITWRIIVQ
ncbi:MAG: hypothetical protein ACD_3C00172G0004 [uncultured bacterium (gcode 4)]|uniref:Uncharacterized protein n=1 Tax=uncultured bacterium (gcode 4) TaxID=1234023 RepID=K2G0L8_9BACT|nr:MAG: hypothetical protein ACD_3C00172G0004 [uncultured bacterium (gcode 4)]